MYEYRKNTTKSLEDINVSLKLKFAALWTSFMFLYIYVDYFHLYMPSKIEDIQTGKVFEFDITQGFLWQHLASVAIPALMHWFRLLAARQLTKLKS